MLINENTKVITLDILMDVRNYEEERMLYVVGHFNFDTLKEIFINLINTEFTGKDEFLKDTLDAMTEYFKDDDFLAVPWDEIRSKMEINIVEELRRDVENLNFYYEDFKEFYDFYCSRHFHYLKEPFIYSNVDKLGKVWSMLKPTKLNPENQKKLMRFTFEACLNNIEEFRVECREDFFHTMEALCSDEDKVKVTKELDRLYAVQRKQSTEEIFSKF